MSDRFEEYRKELKEKNLSGIADLENLLKPLVKEASRMILQKIEPAEKHTQLYSHFGGDPYFEEGEEWPGMDIGSPATFICQVFNDGKNNLPEDVELVQFYYDYEYRPCRSSEDGWYVKVYQELSIHEMEYMPAPDGIRKTNYCRIQFESVKSLPTWEELKFRCPLAFKLSCVLDEKKPWGNYGIAAHKLIGKSDYHSQVGGYAQWIQGAQIPIKENRAEFQFLMQMDSEDDAGLLWRDMGLVYLFWDNDTDDTRFVLQSC